jgi:hypothetical protein
MKTLHLVLLSMSFLTSLFGGAPKKDTWAVAKISSPDGRAGLFRYREALPERGEPPRLSEEISISWKFEGAMPDSVTNKAMVEFEDALAPLGSGGGTYLMFVSTVGGRREWCYYANDYAAFMAQFNSCLRGKPRFPLVIEHTHDPEWKYWHSFADVIEKK